MTEWEEGGGRNGRGKKEKKEALFDGFSSWLVDERKVKGKNEGPDEKTRQMENQAIIAFTSKHNCCCFDEENLSRR